MKLIRFILISIIVCGLIISGITSLLPSTVIVSRAREMKMSDSSFDYYVKQIEHWPIWMEDVKSLNKTAKNNYTVGSQLIQVDSIGDHFIKVKWVAKDQAPFYVQIEKVPLNDGLSVIHWSFEQHLPWYPWEKLQSLLNEKIIGYKMESELEHLSKTIQSPITQ